VVVGVALRIWGLHTTQLVVVQVVVMVVLTQIMNPQVMVEVARLDKVPQVELLQMQEETVAVAAAAQVKLGSLI
jgi:hypothetical protein